MSPAPPTYRFSSRWQLGADPRRVYDVLEDVAAYPQWWPQVRAVAAAGEEVALVACRSALPYTLHVELRPVVRDRDGGELTASLAGDLVGTCSWRLGTVPGGTVLHFEQQVTTPGRGLRAMARVARPALELNHAWMMRGARRGLTGRTAP
ncbi:MAG: SRPBCC family protein [Nocardioides sp.]